VRRALLNLLLRRLVKPLWRGAPTIETLRRQAALVDRRFGGAGAREGALAERLGTELDALWLGPRERAAEGAVLHLHGGAFCVHLPARRIVLAGDSAGGNLVRALLQRSKRLGPFQRAPRRDVRRAGLRRRDRPRPAAHAGRRPRSVTAARRLERVAAAALSRVERADAARRQPARRRARPPRRRPAQAPVWLDLPHAFPRFGVLPQALQCRASMAPCIGERLATAPVPMAGKWIVPAEPMFEH
jgi:hypothetical protein